MCNCILIRLDGDDLRRPFFWVYFAKFGRSWITTQVALKKPFSNKWKNEIPPFTSPGWNLIWHKRKAQKEVALLWSVLHKVVVINEWQGESRLQLTKVAHIVA